MADPPEQSQPQEGAEAAAWDGAEAGAGAASQDGGAAQDGAAGFAGGEGAEAEEAAESGESAESVGAAEQGGDSEFGEGSESAETAASGEFAAPGGFAESADSTESADSAEEAAFAGEGEEPADSAEPAGPPPFAAAPSADVDDGEEPETVGAYLGWHRRRRGVSVRDLAALTRIPARSLQRLEAGAFDTQTDGYARSFVRTVAGAIGIDPDEAVLRMHTETWDDREPRLRGVARLLIATGVLLACLLLGGLLWSWVASLLPAGDAGAPLPVRRDAVRALAEDRGLIGGGAVEPLRPDGALLPAPGRSGARPAAPRS
ncbi:MAG: helix-turn-helix transcriptional regulator, partial [Deltaproteobacteria bacterium]|nr:helix-turn-helix transcriptional regulator [Deltaproteobacteria bacterium]